MGIYSTYGGLLAQLWRKTGVGDDCSECNENEMCARGIDCRGSTGDCCRVDC